MFTVGNRQGVLKTILIDKVGYQESRTTFLYGVGQEFQNLADIRLRILWLEVDQFANDIKNMFFPLLRRNKFLDLIREKHHTDLIVILYSRKSQCRSDLRNNLFLHYVHGTKVSTTRYIDQQHHGQFALFFEHLYIRAHIAGGHVPVDIADIVAVLILAYFAERHTTTFKGRVVLSCKNIAGQAAGLYFNSPNLL